MDDLISRQAAIDALARIAREKFNLSDEYGQYLAGLMDAQVEIEKLPSAQPEQKWIPCSERLPEVPCLVSDANNNFPYVPAGIITLEDKEHGKWAIDGKWFERMMLDGKEADMLIYSNRIVAWMPLPEPYKEGGADG